MVTRRKVILDTERAKHLINIKPDSEYGLTHTLLKHKLTVDEWDDLSAYMYQQAQALEQDDEGNAVSVIFTHDFRSWVEGGRRW